MMPGPQPAYQISGLSGCAAIRPENPTRIAHEIRSHLHCVRFFDGQVLSGRGSQNQPRLISQLSFRLEHSVPMVRDELGLRNHRVIWPERMDEAHVEFRAESE